MEDGAPIDWAGNVELAGLEVDWLATKRDGSSNLQLRIAHLEPQTLALWVLSPHSNREFCVLGIVVHLRLEHYRVPRRPTDDTRSRPTIASAGSKAAWSDNEDIDREVAVSKLRSCIT